jgi:hypothetical protein
MFFGQQCSKFCSNVSKRTYNIFKFTILAVYVNYINSRGNLFYKNLTLCKLAIHPTSSVHCLKPTGAGELAEKKESGLMKVGWAAL